MPIVMPGTLEFGLAWKAASRRGREQGGSRKRGEGEGCELASCVEHAGFSFGLAARQLDGTVTTRVSCYPARQDNNSLLSRWGEWSRAFSDPGFDCPCESLLRVLWVGLDLADLKNVALFVG